MDKCYDSKRARILLLHLTSVRHARPILSIIFISRSILKLQILLVIVLQPIDVTNQAKI